MKIVYVNCRVKNFFEGRSLQLYTQLMQLRKESLKKIQANSTAPSWLVSLMGRPLHRYRGGKGFESGFLFATA